MVEEDIKYHIGNIEQDGICLRKCRECREIKELNEDNFIRRKTENGWRGKCRICYNKSIRVKMESNNTEKARTLKYTTLYKQNFPLKHLLNIAKGNAKRKFREFSITLENLEDVFKTQKGLCYYTGRPLNLELGKFDSLSIDRVNSSKGYIKDNIVLCRYKINVMKNDISKEDLIRICKDIIKTHQDDSTIEYCI